MTVQKQRWFLGSAALTTLVFATAPAVADDASASMIAPTGGQQDIIVTATKRRESLMQVAAPISAISGDQLAKNECQQPW